MMVFVCSLSDPYLRINLVLSNASSMQVPLSVIAVPFVYSICYCIQSCLPQTFHMLLVLLLPFDTPYYMTDNITKC